MVNRRGFGLVEVIVAMTLLGIAVMSMAASAVFASRLLRIAESEEDAARIAETLVDSIALAPQRVTGSRVVERFHADWSASAASVRVTVTPHDTSGMRSISLELLLPPALDTVPCATCND